ncbi:MAG TPA: hypothetical protein VEL75_12220, partial [Candidatus Methylomirabilis sp.]|nr:hypothetical protein [Candidatus Methylomirabilis sp.]
EGEDLRPIKRLLIERAEGNPFFLEEGVRSLVEQKVLVGTRGQRRLGKTLAHVQVPATVQAILAARIDDLSMEHKRLLQCAAVIGKSFPLPLLRAVAGATEGDLQQGLAQLQSREFLYETNLFPDIEYTFKHALTQEVAYRSLLQERRRDLHARILASMEALYADRLGERVERLAHHAVHGAVWDKAVTYLRQAGHRALERSTSREAVSLFEQALAALRHMPERPETAEQAIDIRLDVRLALVPLAEREQIAQHLEAAEKLARSLEDRHRLAWIAYSWAHYHYMSHDQERAVEAGRQAIELGGGADFALEVAVNMVLGYAFHTMGEFRPAIDVLRKNIDRLQGSLTRERFGLPVIPAVTCRERLVRCVAELGEFEEGIRRGEEGLALAEEIDQPLSLTQMYLGLGHLYLRKADLARAVPVLERGMAVGRRWQISLLVATLISAVGHAYVLLGRVGEGMPLLEEGFQMAESRGAMLGHALRVIWLADGHLVQGRVELAREHAARALQLSRDHKERALEAWALEMLGEATAAGDSPDLAGAERFFGQAAELADALGMRPLIAHCRLGLGRLYRRSGRGEESERSLAAAAALFAELDMPFWSRRVAEAAAL